MSNKRLLEPLVKAIAEMANPDGSSFKAIKKHLGEGTKKSILIAAIKAGIKDESIVESGKAYKLGKKILSKDTSINIFVSDVEGDEASFMKRIRHYISIQSVSATTYENLLDADLFQFLMLNLLNVRVKPGYNIIIGGDVIDKRWQSNHENFVMNDLYVFVASLKRNNYDNVFLIAGNRDSNKTRVGPIMDKFFKMMGIQQNLPITQDFIAAFNGPADAGLSQGLKEMMAKGDKITAIKFVRLILDKTMGIISNDFLSHLAKQVSRETSKAVTDVTEKQIVAQFIANFSVGSAWHEYMKEARIYHIIGSNLFSHCVPVPYKSDEMPCNNVAELLEDLNTFYMSNVHQIGVSLDANLDAWDIYWLPNAKSWATTTFAHVKFDSAEYQALLAAFQKAGIKIIGTCHAPIGATPGIQLLDYGVTLFRLDMHTQPTAAVNIDTGLTTTENICYLEFDLFGGWTCSGTAFGTNYASSNKDPNLGYYGKSIEIGDLRWVIRNISGGFVHLHYFFSNAPAKIFDTKYKCLEVTDELLEQFKL